MSSSSAERSERDLPVGLVALLAALVAVRFFRLGEWGLWIDEAFTLHDIRAAVAGREPWPANPLGYRLVGAWLDLCGSRSELALRVLPACFGAAALPLLYWAVRPFLGVRAALVAAVLLGANTWTLYWAQNARFYSIAQTLAIVAAGCLARALFPVREAGLARGLVWLACALASFGAAALVHPSALLYAAAACGAPFVLWLSRVRPEGSFRRITAALLVTAVVGAAASMPWALGLWRKYTDSKSDASPLHFVLTTGYHVTPWLAAAALLGVLRVRRERVPFDAWIAVAALGTLGVAFGLSLAARVSAQYVFVALPAIAVLAALGLEDLARRKRAWGTIAFAVLVCASLADQTHYFFARNGDRERWRDAYQYVWNSRGPNDLIVGMAAPVGEYYLAPNSTSFRQPLALEPLTTYNAPITLQWARRGRRIWYVVLDEWLAEWPRDDRARLETFLDESGHMIAEFPVRHPIRDLTVRVWLVE